jgi:hypothetical protein
MRDIGSQAITDDARVVAQLNETHGRCRVLFMEQRERWTTRERIDSISAGLNPLYSTRPPAAQERRALSMLALAGWCWREAERGDPAPIRRQILASYKAAVAEPGVEGPLVPAWAGWKFLADGGQPGLASPGDSKRVRLAFLDAAFAKIHNEWGAPAGIPQDKARSAFHHGVVLSDVERLALGRPSFV